MTHVGKLMIVLGGVLILLGAVIWLLGRAGFRGLPGDIVYETNGTRIYFPVVTMLALSALLTLGLWLWNWLTQR